MRSRLFLRLLFILGGFYAGLLTPSESAAVSGVWSILFGFLVYRELALISLIDCLKQTTLVTAVIFAIIAMATFLSVVLTYTQAPQIVEFGATPLMFWIMVAVICLILGTFIEIVPVFYLTVPIFAAITYSLKLDILHLYIVIVAFAGIGMITPPVCISIYTAAGVIQECPEKAFREVPLFVIVGIAYGALMIVFPAAATRLPDILLN